MTKSVADRVQEKAEKTNGSSNVEGANWPGLTKAATMLNVPHSWITKMHREGALRAVSYMGAYRFDPESLEELRALVTTLDEEELNPPKPRAPGISADEFKAGTELAKNCMTWFERMFVHIPITIEKLHQVSAVQVEGLRAEIKLRDERISKLEADRDASIAAREKMLNEETERALMTRMFENAERRKDKALGVITDKLAPVVLSKLGLDGDPRVAKALKLVNSMSRDQMLMLIAVPGVVTDAQREQILSLLGELSAEEKEKLGTATETQPTKEETHGS